MKAIKIIAAIVISAVLIIAGGLLGGVFSVDKALSEDSIRDSVSQTDIISELVDEALSESTVNMGGEYGDMVAAVFKTDAMEGFFTDYMTAAIHSEVYGKTYEEIADDELMAAFSQGIGEVNQEGAINISTMEGELLKQAMQEEIPDLTAELNSNISRYDTTDSDITEDATTVDDDMQTLMGVGVKVVLIIVCLGLSVALVALFWRSKLGFIWCAVVTAIVTFFFGIFSLVGTESVLGTAVTSSDQLVLSLAGKGLHAATVAGIIITVLFIAACLLLRHFDKKRGKNISSTEQASTWKRAD